MLDEDDNISAFQSMNLAFPFRILTTFSIACFTELQLFGALIFTNFLHQVDFLPDQTHLDAVFISEKSALQCCVSCSIPNCISKYLSNAV